MSTYSENVALVDGTLRWTYAELFAHAKQYAARIHLNDIIAIPAVRSAHTIAAILGTLLAGGTYLPLDFDMPKHHLHEILSRANVNAILHPHDITLSYQGPLPVLNLDLQQDLCSLHAPSGDTPAYILFTSGSTGEPKGVAVSHRSLSFFCHAAIELFHLSSHDRTLQFCTLQWDTSNEEIWPTLLQGACLVLRSKRAIEPVEDLLSLTEQESISVWNLPTSYWVECIKTMINHEIPLPPSLRLVIIGGEELSESVFSLWQKIARHSDVSLLNTYGLTECTSISLANILSSEHLNHPLLPIGRSIPGTRCAILDEEGNALPPHAIGSLHIGGTGLALATSHGSQQLFTPMKTSLLWDGPYLSTGDVAYYDSSGTVTYIKRSEDIIKRHGVRIAPAMIERALLSSPFVHMASVITIEHLGAPYLIAAVVPFEPTATTEELIWKNLRSELSSHLLPDTIFILPSLPRLGNGKINRQALRNLFLNRPVKLRQKPIDNPTLKSIVDIWQEILSIPSVPTDRPFFECGGNSLLLLRLQQKLQQRFFLLIDIAELFVATTCEQQATLITTHQFTTSEHII